MIKKIEKKHLEHLKSFIRDSLFTASKKGVVLGASGGVDSSVCLCLAREALGKDKCRAFYMPHRGAGEPARALKLLCSRLGIKLGVYDLRGLTGSFSDMTGTRDPILLGNFAARLRSAFLYGEAGAADLLVMNTSNRSERMTGYFTKWGDETGDISPLGAYYKSEVLTLASYLNIPEPIISAAPSADFHPGQKDEEELGISYKQLDRVLDLIDKGRESGADKRILKKVKAMIEKSSHKRNSPLTAERVI